jgi:hypothetical protein
MTKELFQEYQDSAPSGYYVHHLSNLSNSRNEALTTGDILNTSGVLLARKGTKINEDIRNRLIKHKLFKPLDSNIRLQHQVDNQYLIQKFRELMAEHSDLNQINDILRFGPDFEKLLTLERLHPVLMQKLTVLDSQMHSEFE